MRNRDHLYGNYPSYREQNHQPIIKGYYVKRTKDKDSRAKESDRQDK